MQPKFTIEFLQSLNDWQAGAISKKDKNGIYNDNIKIKLANNIIKTSINIPKEFKSFNGSCYRKFNSGNNMELGLKEFINEKYSSWTTDFENLKTSKTLKNPKKNEIGIIFKKDIIYNCNVILNLNALYCNKEFLEFIDDNKNEIKNFENGIGKYNNSQNEIILENTKLHIDNIIAYYGKGSEIMDFIRTYFPEVMDNEKEKQELITEIRKRAPDIGKKKWLEGEGAIKIIKKHKILAKLLS